LVNNAVLWLALTAWFGLLALGEVISARRNPRGEHGGDSRLVTNFGLGVMIFLVAGLVPLAKVGSSQLGQYIGSGIAPRLAMSWIAIVVTLLIADSFAVYWTHRLMHRVPLLWRLHRVHHADASVDVSTSLRNHPLELAVTIPASAAVVLIIGAPPSAIVAAQTVAFAAAMWQHADIDLPPRLDRALSLIVVTPGVHRLHHSPDRRLHDGNYGELITSWDRLFGTFNASGKRGRVGLDRQVARPDRLLQQIWSPIHAA